VYKQQDARRPSAAERGYDAEWRRRRKAFLARNPWCGVVGCGKRATEVHHEVPNSDDERDWRPRCKSHHSATTMRELNQSKKL
jgi:hypothetical protein